MKTLLVLNEQPYGTKRSYNALRPARELYKTTDARNEGKVLLIGAAPSCARASQRIPQRYCNIGQTLKSNTRHGG